VTAICVLYVLLVRRVGGRSRLGSQSGEVLSTSLKAAAARRRVMRMVTAVIVTFAVCWLPTHVAFLVEAYASEHVHVQYRMELVGFQIGATCLAYANSCLNPVIYTFLSENFRQSFRELLSIASSRQNSGARRSRQDAEGARHVVVSDAALEGRADLAIPLNPIGLQTPTAEISAYRTVCTDAI